MKTYNVLRRHYSDRFHEEGEERDANPAEVGHLVAAGVLVEKAAKRPENKAEPKPRNKAN